MAEAARPLHVALPTALSAKVRALAARRGDRPAVFVAAAMARIVADDLTEAVLDGDRAAETAPGHGRRDFEALPGGLTLLQAGVLYIIGFHADEDGVCRLPTTHFARLLGKSSQNHVATIPPVLEQRRLVEAVREKHGARRWKLTWRGKAVFRALAGERGE